jgi:hypothetical protein
LFKREYSVRRKDLEPERKMETAEKNSNQGKQEKETGGLIFFST